MTDTHDPMLKIIQCFLNNHFPDDKHQIFDYGYEHGSDYSVAVGDNKLSFKVFNRSVYDVVIHKDHYDSISKLFHLHEHSHDSINIVNMFIDSINNNSLFLHVFNPVQKMDLSQYLTTFSKHQDDCIDVYDMDKKFYISTKFNSTKFPSLIQLSFSFTADNHLKCFPVIALFFNTDVDSRIAFNLDTQQSHRILSSAIIYEDYFFENKVIDVDKEIEKIVHNFVDDVIVKHSEEMLESNNLHLNQMSFIDKIEIFKMISI